MAVEPLPEAMKDMGRKLLRATDEVGLEAQGAAWVYSHILHEWRYYLVTSLVDTKGPKWVYDRLLQVFPRFNLTSGMSIVDVHLGSPKDALFTKIAGIVATETGEFHFVKCMIGDEEFDAIVYRMRTGLRNERLMKIETEFDDRVKQKVAAPT